VIAEGKPGVKIVKLASLEHCDAVVISTHGRTGLKRAMLGSVADYVAHDTGGGRSATRSPHERRQWLIVRRTRLTHLFRQDPAGPGTLTRSRRTLRWRPNRNSGTCELEQLLRAPGQSLADCVWRRTCSRLDEPRERLRNRCCRAHDPQRANAAREGPHLPRFGSLLVTRPPWDRRRAEGAAREDGGGAAER
jgi:hypothetical protein